MFEIHVNDRFAYRTTRTARFGAFLAEDRFEAERVANGLNRKMGKATGLNWFVVSR